MALLPSPTPAFNPPWAKLEEPEDDGARLRETDEDDEPEDAAAFAVCWRGEDSCEVSEEVAAPPSEDEEVEAAGSRGFWKWSRGHVIKKVNTTVVNTRGLAILREVILSRNFTIPKAVNVRMFLPNVWYVINCLLIMSDLVQGEITEYWQYQVFTKTKGLVSLQKCSSREALIFTQPFKSFRQKRRNISIKQGLKTRNRSGLPTWSSAAPRSPWSPPRRWRSESRGWSKEVEDDGSFWKTSKGEKDIKIMLSGQGNCVL